MINILIGTAIWLTVIWLLVKLTIGWDRVSNWLKSRPNIGTGKILWSVVILLIGITLLCVFPVWSGSTVRTYNLKRKQLVEKIAGHKDLTIEDQLRLTSMVPDPLPAHAEQETVVDMNRKLELVQVEVEKAATNLWSLDKNWPLRLANNVLKTARELANARNGAYYLVTRGPAVIPQDESKLEYYQAILDYSNIPPNVEVAVCQFKTNIDGWPKYSSSWAATCEQRIEYRLQWSSISGETAFTDWETAPEMRFGGSGLVDPTVPGYEDYGDPVLWIRSKQPIKKMTIQVWSQLRHVPKAEDVL